MSASELDRAIEANDFQEFKRLVEGGADLRHLGDYDSTPLANAAVLGRLEMVKFLLDRGVEPTYGGYRSVIVVPCGLGHFEVCEALLKAGVSPDESTDEETNCMTMAIFKAHLDIVKLLVEYGADLEPIDEYIEYAEELNTNGSHDEVIAYLKQLRSERMKA